MHPPHFLIFSYVSDLDSSACHPVIMYYMYYWLFDDSSSFSLQDNFNDALTRYCYSPNYSPNYCYFWMHIPLSLLDCLLRLCSLLLCFVIHSLYTTFIADFSMTVHHSLYKAISVVLCLPIAIHQTLSKLLGLLSGWQYLDALILGLRVCRGCSMSPLLAF